MVLSLFSISYYTILLVHGFIEPFPAIQCVLAINLAYLIGFNSGDDTIASWPHGLCWVFLAMIMGPTIFSLLSTQTSLDYYSSFETFDREIPGYWLDAGKITTTIFGTMTAPACCLLSVTLLGFKESSKTDKYKLMFFCGIFSLVGIYVNLILQNRMPLVTMAFVIILAFVYYIFTDRKNYRTVFYALSLFLISATVYYYFQDYIQDFSIMNRFKEEKFDNPRYSAWFTMLSGGLFNVFGGRTADLGKLKYAHNLWLDVSYDAGIVPFLLLLGFYLAHCRSVFTVFRSNLPNLVTLFIFVIWASTLASYFFEPVIQASPIFFALNSFFFGVISRLEILAHGTEPCVLAYRNGGN
ncbi:hypothetical protein [Geomonas limicola]|uniref:hypothetical protein n=1 Tax=Geomonas limicola TaxID=2740186 RepID=UPI00162033EF|nr:hypothetical protein [Geomonas limicola]